MRIVVSLEPDETPNAERGPPTEVIHAIATACPRRVVSAGDAAPRPPVPHRTVDYGVCVRREREILRTMSTYHACLITVWPAVEDCADRMFEAACALSFVCAQGSEAGPRSPHRPIEGRSSWCRPE